MGGFINSQADAEICEVLNKRFSDEINPNDPQRRTYLSEIRDFVQHTEALFDGSHRLHRTFHRLATSVTTAGASVPRNQSSRLRWFHLLNGRLPNSVETAIRGQLNAICGLPAGNPASAVDYVTFSTIHQTTSSNDQFELYDNKNRDSSTPNVQTDANGKTYCALILVCKVDQQLPNGSGESDPPRPEPGGERRIPFASRKPTRKRSAARKGAVKKKKTAKKTSKTAGKKKAAKK